MRSFFFIAILATALYSCNQKPARHHLNAAELVARQDSLKGDLLKTDLAFSQLSNEKGRQAAFAQYADSNATVLREFSEPTNGKDAIIKLLSEHPDTGAKLTWIPITSDVALSGDLGYTYGTYTFQAQGSAKQSSGTYCTVWRRSRANNWKFLLSTGNKGLKPADTESEDGL